MDRREVEYAAEQDIVVNGDEHTSLCECFEDLLPTLKPEYAEVIQALDLDERDPEIVAKDLGITRGNPKVRAHRARQRLRTQLEQTCRLYAKHGCFDCSCIR